MLVIAKLYLFISLFACLVFVAKGRKKKPEKKLRISKTLIPLEYTGKDYREWIRNIKIERQILSIQNGTDTDAYSGAIKENILKLINK